MCWIVPAWAMAAPMGKISYIEGNVDISPAGSPAARPAAKGDPVGEGDTLRAKSHSKVEVIFADSNILRLAENTRVRITTYQMGEGRQNTVDLFRGKMQSIVRNPGKNGRYEVHTPTAICGVRGTDFFAFFQNGISGATPREGTIYVYNTKYPRDAKSVAVGQSAIVADENRLPVIQPVSETDLEMLSRDTSPTEQPSELDETVPQPGTLLLPPARKASDTVSLIDFFTGVIPVYLPLMPNNDTIDHGVIGGIFTTDVTLLNASQLSAVHGWFSIASTPATSLTAYITDETSPALGEVDGLATDGTRFTGYLGGIPGSWSGLFRSVYLQGQNVGYATSDLSGSLSAGSLSAQGKLTMGATLGQVASAYMPFTYPIPVMDSILNTSSVYSLPVIVTDPSVIWGYKTTSGTVASVWALMNKNSTYINSTGASSWTSTYGTYGSYAGTSYYMLGAPGVLNATDPGLVGTETLLNNQYHVTLNGDIVSLDPSYLGVFDISYVGVYNRSLDNGSTHGGYGSNIGLGTFTQTPLDFSSILYNNATYQLTNDGTNWSFSSGNFDGLMGGIGAWWESGTSALHLMGTMGYSDAITVPPVFQAEMNMTNASGAYLALLGGSKDSANGIAGFIEGIYMKSNNEVGIIYSTNSSSNETIGGTYYPDLGMWAASGNAYTYAMGTIAAGTGWTLSNFVSQLSQTSYSYQFGVPGLPTDQSTDLYLGSIDRIQIDFGALGPTQTGNFFGVWSDIMGGAYNAALANPGGYWNWSIDGSLASPAIPNHWEYMSVYINPASNSAITGNIASGIVDWTSAQTFVAGGVIKGTFDPAAPNTWNVVGAGTYMETAAFLNTVNPMNAAARAAFEQATKIPAFEVGSVDLAGSQTYGSDTLSVTMKNVEFFAFTTDPSNPRIWASSNVYGSYGSSTGATPPISTSVALSPISGSTSTISPTFTVQNWTSNQTVNQWGATVAGSGTLNTTSSNINLNMKGGAAGTYNTGSLTFTGTAAGSSWK
jgi:hypothetical protein